MLPGRGGGEVGFEARLCLGIPHLPSTRRRSVVHTDIENRLDGHGAHSWEGPAGQDPTSNAVGCVFCARACLRCVDDGANPSGRNKTTVPKFDGNNAECCSDKGADLTKGWGGARGTSPHFVVNPVKLLRRVH